MISIIDNHKVNSKMDLPKDLKNIVYDYLKYRRSNGCGNIDFCEEFNNGEWYVCMTCIIQCYNFCRDCNGLTHGGNECCDCEFDKWFEKINPR